jgi:magnesium-transporting ATPase (P-type)
MIPADLLLLNADSPKCYLDTCSLDGETNLK